MARTKDAVLAPGQKELMEKEYLDFVKPSTYGNIANPSSCNSLYDDVENPELRAIVEKVAATLPIERKHQRTRLNRHRIRRSASVASSARRHWRSISRHSSKFQGLTTASRSSSVPMYETVLTVSSASSEEGA